MLGECSTLKIEHRARQTRNLRATVTLLVLPPWIFRANFRITRHVAGGGPDSSFTCPAKIWAVKIDARTV